MEDTMLAYLCIRQLHVYIQVLNVIQFEVFCVGSAVNCDTSGKKPVGGGSGGYHWNKAKHDQSSFFFFFQK